MKGDAVERIEKALRGIKSGADMRLEPASIVEAEGVTYAFVESAADPKLCVAGKDGCAKSFEGAETIRMDHGSISLCALTHANAAELRRRLPFTAPSPLGQKRVTIGVGDRLGLAGRGHIRAIRAYRASPVLAQQSVRELTLTSRTFTDVLDSSTWAVFAEGFRGPWGADGDHLKAEDKVMESLSAGYTMITADVSDSLHPAFARAGDAEVDAAYGKLDAAHRKDIETRFSSFSKADLRRAALIYGDAVEHAARLYRAGMEVRGVTAFDFELSIDETDTPTTPQAHQFIAMEAKRKGIAFTSLAPRFVGEFQKGIDYIGSVAEFEESFAAHARIAETLGYRISVHSGSDKFAVFPAVGRLSGGRFHLKTAGTSWLEALRVIAAKNPALFKELYAGALAGYDNARKLYHVTPDLSTLPKPENLGETARLLQDVHARRVLHIAYGELLAVPRLKERLYAVLHREAEAYREALKAHIGRHLELLGVEKAGDA
jgi:hypothetical protein